MQRCGRSDRPTLLAAFGSQRAVSFRGGSPCVPLDLLLPHQRASVVPCVLLQVTEELVWELFTQVGPVGEPPSAQEQQLQQQQQQQQQQWG